MHFYIMYNNVIVTLRVSHIIAVSITISHVLVISFQFHFVCVHAAVLTHKNLHTHSGCSTFLISVQSNPYLQMDSLFFIAPSLSRRERVIHTKLFCTSITLCKYSVMCINKNANTHTQRCNENWHLTQ